MNTEFDIKIRNCRIEYKKGCYLEGDVYLPNTDHELPVILFRTPYGKQNVYALFDPIKVARMGFVVLVQNVRGRYQSNGVFDPFINEKQDGELTINWLKEQKWCNGIFFSIGISYEGFTALMCSEHKDVCGVASIVSASNIKNEWFFENGNIRQGFVLAWSHGIAVTDTNRLKDYEKDQIRKLGNDILKLYHKPINEFPAGRYLPYYKYWIENKESIYWANVQKKTNINLRNVNGYFVTGWYDIFCEGTIRDFLKVQNETSKSQKLVIGPWSHNELFGPQVGQVDFGTYNFKDYDQYDIFDWFLKLSNGRNDDCTTQISAFIMGENKWHTFDSWPPKFKSQKLFVTGQTIENECVTFGNLDWENTTLEGFDEYTYDPKDLVPSLGGRILDSEVMAIAGPVDQNRIIERNDTLKYKTDSLKDDVTIIGLVKMKLIVSCNTASASYTVKLLDINPKGLAINVIDSCKVVKFNKANDAKEVNIELGTIGYTFLENHSIGVIISSSSFPRLSDPNQEFDRTVKHRVYWGCNTPVELIIPVV